MPALRTTLDCKDAESWLGAWLDRELASEDRALLEAHLEACAACREKGEVLSRLKDALRQGALLHREAPAPLVDAVRGGVRRAARRERAIRAAQVLSVLVLVTGAGVAAWTFLPQTAELPRDALRPVIAEAVERHTLDVPVDVASPDPARVQAFLKPRIGHDVVVPRLDGAGLGLLGARVVNVENRRAAQLVYMGGLGRRVSVVAVPDPGRRLGAALLADGGRRLGHAEGFSVELWSRGDTLYSIVGDVEPARLSALVDALEMPQAQALAGDVVPVSLPAR